MAAGVRDRDDVVAATVDDGVALRAAGFEARIAPAAHALAFVMTDDEAVAVAEDAAVAGLHDDDRVALALFLPLAFSSLTLPTRAAAAAFGVPKVCFSIGGCFGTRLDGLLRVELPGWTVFGSASAPASGRRLRPSSVSCFGSSFGWVRGLLRLSRAWLLARTSSAARSSAGSSLGARILLRTAGACGCPPSCFGPPNFGGVLGLASARRRTVLAAR